jgi:hypothetical protein
MRNTDQTMFADGFEKAVIGFHWDGDVPRVIYDKKIMLDILIEDEDMTIEDAIEYLEYNVFSAYVGEGTPIYIEPGNYEEVVEFVKSID